MKSTFFRMSGGGEGSSQQLLRMCGKLLIFRPRILSCKLSGRCGGGVRAVNNKYLLAAVLAAASLAMYLSVFAKFGAQ